MARFLYATNPAPNHQKGFSLIELLVVIAIIGILVAIVFASFSHARAKARDAKRLSDLKQLQAAIEVYGQAHGQYPAMGCGATGWSGHNNYYGPCEHYIEGISDLIDPLPVDPKDPTVGGFLYWTNGPRTEYKLLMHNSVESETVTPDHPYARCPAWASCSETWCQPSNGTFGKTYAVYSSGAVAVCR